MPAPKFNLVINRILLGIILLGGLALVGILGVLGIVSWHFIHTAYIERSWVNPIRDETFQVDLDLDAEGQSYHITRAYKCDDVDVFTGGEHGIERYVYPSQRIITQHLPSGHIIFVAVPDGCYPIWRMRVLRIPCEDSNDFSVGTSHAEIDCSAKRPVIRNHIPLVLWTKDIGKPRELIAYLNSASLESSGSNIRRAIARVTIQEGLPVSPPDENNWLATPLSPKPDGLRVTYFGYAAFEKMSCDKGTLNWYFYSYRLGTPIPEQSAPCIIPFDADGNAMVGFSGLLFLHSNPASVKRPHNIPITSVGMSVKEQEEKGHDR